MTTLTENQTCKKTRTIGAERLDVIIRYDDQCGNGHNTFVVTGTLYEQQISGRWREGASGVVHDEVRRFFPELAPLLKWHLCSSAGPLHYFANTLYHAGDKDHNGLKKGERRQIRNGATGLPCWRLVAQDEKGNYVDLHMLEKYIDAEERPPCPYTLKYAPWWQVGEGKEPNLEAARASAIWPDATLEQLQDRAQLEARLPALTEEFKAAVENLGFTY